MAAAEGAVLELRLRLLADKIPALQQYAHAHLEDVETEISKHFIGVLLKKDIETFALCRRLRNKVLHCDFRAARDKLEKLTATVRRGDVKKIDISGLASGAVVQKLRAANDGVAGTFEYVADTSSTAPGSVFGWLLELGQAGDFNEATRVFKEAVRIIDRLTNIP